MTLTSTLESLAELVNTASVMRRRAGACDLVGLWVDLGALVRTIDATYVQLEDHGEPYLQTAYSFLDAGRLRLTRARIVIEASEGARRRAES